MPPRPAPDWKLPPHERRAARAGRRSTEESIHRAVADFLRVALLDSECLWWHCPNGGARSKGEAGKMKGLGARPGVPDLSFILPGGGTAFIELKADGGLSPAQRAFRTDAEAIGAKWALCRSVEEVEETLRTWGVPLHANLMGAATVRRVA